MAKGRLGQLPLVERDRELAAVDNVASAVVSGPTARLVLVTGEPGSGKTRFVAEVVERLRPEWASVSVGGESTQESWSTPFTGLIDDIETEGAPARALARSLAASLTDRRDGRPIVLAVDDLQFVDPIAISVLESLLPELRRQPLLVVATYRFGSRRLGTPHSRAVASLLRYPAAAELRLASLTPEGVAALAAAYEYEGDTDELFARCDGNPFLAEEAMRVGSAASASEVSGLVLADLAELSDPAANVALTLACAGGPLARSVAMRFDPDGVGVAELMDRGLVVGTDAVVRLRHGLVAEALMAPTTDDERRERHRALAEALQDDGSAPDEDLARHWAAAGDAARAAPLAVRAADRFHGQRFHATAVDLYRIGLSAGDESSDGEPASRAERDAVDPSGRLALLEKAAMSAALAGNEAQASAWVRELREASRAAGPVWAASTTWKNPAFQRLVRSQDDHGDQPEDTSELSVRLLRAQELAQAGEHEAAGELARDVAEVARSLGERLVECDALLVVGYTGDLEAAAAGFARIADDAEAAGELAAATAALSRLSRIEIGLGDLAKSIDASRRALATGRRAGGPEMWGNIQTGAAFIYAIRGEIDEASRLGAELAALELPLLAAFSQAVDWIVAVDRGDVEEAVRLRDVILPLARAFGDTYFLVPMLLVAARTHLLSGDVTEADVLLNEAISHIWSPLHEQTVDVVHVWICCTVARGDDEGLLPLRARANELTRLVNGPSMRGLAEFAEGSVRAGDGDHRGAAESFERAARSYLAAERRPMALDAWCAAAAAHLETVEQHGALDPSSPAAERAIDAAASLVATYRLERCAAEVSALRARQAAVQPVVVDPLAALDERERTMVLLAASGSTNREIGAELFISEKTVRNCLTAAFAKVGVSRRTELRDLLDAGTIPST